MAPHTCVYFDDHMHCAVLKETVCLTLLTGEKLWLKTVFKTLNYNTFEFISAKHDIRIIL